MSNPLGNKASSTPSRPDVPPPLDWEADAPLSAPARYGLAVALVAATTVIAFGVDRFIQPSNLSLIFVLPVVVAAASFGWGPALVAAMLSVLAFDFLFIEPRYSLAVANVTDVWGLALMLVIAALVSAVAAQSRRRAIEARAAASQAEALQALAHVVIQSGTRTEVERAAAEVLSRLFKSPAVVLVERGGALATVATAGGAVLSPADEEAARLALSSHLASRGETFPTPESGFDFWPAPGGQYVLGVRLAGAEPERPREPERLVEIVGSYLAAARA